MCCRFRSSIVAKIMIGHKRIWGGQRGLPWSRKLLRAEYWFAALKRKASLNLSADLSRERFPSQRRPFPPATSCFGDFSRTTGLFYSWSQLASRPRRSSAFYLIRPLCRSQLCSRPQITRLLPPLCLKSARARTKLKQHRHPLRAWTGAQNASIALSITMRGPQTSKNVIFRPIEAVIFSN